jgi:hypothetical protein
VSASRRILFLDDDRARGESFLAHNPCAVWVRTAAECIEHLAEPWDEVHLDHDLGGEHFVEHERDDCGMEVVRWLCQELRPHLSKAQFVVHTHNATAACAMSFQLGATGYRVRESPFKTLPPPPPAPRILLLDDHPERGESFLHWYPGAAWVRTAAECIERLAEPWDEVHLDYDLGGKPERGESGLEVVQWLCEESRPHLSETQFVVHTHDVVAACGMGFQLAATGYRVRESPFGPPAAPRTSASSWIGRWLARLPRFRRAVAVDRRRAGPLRN